MKYGYNIRAVRAHSYPEIKALALQAEEYGFDSVHVPDHLIGFDPERKQPFLEAIALMSAIAVETQKVKIGHVVLANSFRNPALTAKIISSLDNISNGRVLLWIGAGWYEDEYKAYGYPFPSANERVDQLEESLTIFKRLFTEDVTTFEGKFWKLENCKNFPKPIQKPWPQIVIGGRQNRVVTLACREADGINLPHHGLDELEERTRFIASKLKKYNRDPERFEISAFNIITLVNNEEELNEAIRQTIEQAKRSRAAGFFVKELGREQILRNSFIGYVEDIKAKIRRAEDLGVRKMVIFVFGSPSVKDPLKLFHDKLM
jgi:alkanesulfonate monooxygenase SsuD/methylene tetrahydromethanopterin reductase-like flavin-dependent oxidoreductase (luciferase family)